MPSVLDNLEVKNASIFGTMGLSSSFCHLLHDTRGVSTATRISNRSFSKSTAHSSCCTEKTSVAASDTCTQILPDGRSGLQTPLTCNQSRCEKRLSFSLSHPGIRPEIEVSVSTFGYNQRRSQASIPRSHQEINQERKRHQKMHCLFPVG